MRTQRRKFWFAWGVRWISKNHLDGKNEHLIGSVNVCFVEGLEGCTGALMFRTRKSCREYIKKKWGYIRERKDLREEPHGWRMPRAVRIKITVRDLGANP
jgi:hypothetical protein